MNWAIVFLIIWISFFLPDNDIGKIMDAIGKAIAVLLAPVWILMIAIILSAHSWSPDHAVHTEHIYVSDSYGRYDYKPDLRPQPTPAPGKYIEVTSTMHPDLLPGNTWILDFVGVRTRDNTAHAVWWQSKEQYDNAPSGTWFADFDSQAVWRKQ